MYENMFIYMHVYTCTTTLLSPVLIEVQEYHQYFSDEGIIEVTGYYILYKVTDFW